MKETAGAENGRKHRGMKDSRDGQESKREEGGWEKRERERWRCTYVDLTQNDVYNAANYDEEVKNIPGVTKVTLHRTRGRWG